MAFIYGKSSYGDITQGLPNVEHVLKVRSIYLLSIYLKKRIDDLNK